MSVANQHARLTVNRIFEVISPLTIGHILTCQSVAIFTCQNCHNIYISILLPPLRAGAVRCRANVRTSLQLRFLSPNIRKQPKFRYSPLRPGLWVGLYNRTIEDSELGVSSEHDSCRYKSHDCSSQTAI